MKKGLIDTGKYRAVVPISALSGLNLDRLIEEIENLFVSDVKIEMILPNSPESESFLSWLYENAEVEDVERSSEIRVKVECREEIEGKVEKMVEELGGIVKGVHNS